MCSLSWLLRFSPFGYIYFPSWALYCGFEVSILVLQCHFLGPPDWVCVRASLCRHDTCSLERFSASPGSRGTAFVAGRPAARHPRRPSLHGTPAVYSGRVPCFGDPLGVCGVARSGSPRPRQPLAPGAFRTRQSSAPVPAVGFCPRSEGPGRHSVTSAITVRFPSMVTRVFAGRPALCYSSRRPQFFLFRVRMPGN
ncbi:hypothetical protein NDU88_007057 [Pleurodeles waltl]|uniref:Uncharacterized protein n=1 Tax=Pleurodeles waltl TaxID=8319 RepID=A0AAV7LRF3_PLEWA|nr:hypothetical protein NDU88_007057 [Pleurodeles waltl]